MTDLVLKDKDSTILDIDSLELTESLGTFQVSTLLSQDKQKQLAKAQLDLKPGQDIQKSLFKQLFNRQNIIYFGKMLYETPVRIDQCTGHIRISLIDQTQILKQLQKLPEDKRKKIGYIHLSTIQILVKSTFQEGIDSPIRMAILDERMTNLNDQIIGMMNGNLAYGKIKFNARLKLGIPLLSSDLQDTITIAYKFYKENLMTQRQYPFSITYQISYALTNSHYSIDFKNTEQIYIDQLFQDVAKVGTKFHTKIQPLPAIQYPFTLPQRRHSFSEQPTTSQPLLTRSSSSIPRSLPFCITEPQTNKNQKQLDNIQQQITNLSTYVKNIL